MSKEEKKLQEAFDKGTYWISIKCHNCGHVPGGTMTDKNGEKFIPEQIVIPKGTEVKMLLREMTCENCGCDGFMGIL